MLTLNNTERTEIHKQSKTNPILVLQSQDNDVIKFCFKMTCSHSPLPALPCSFDARGSTIENGKHWADEHLLGRRAYFRLHPGLSRGGSSSPGAHLELFPVQDRDEATYRCRVDFLLSPTKNTIVNFTVISEYPQVFTAMFLVLFLPAV